ncbi:MAG: site-specific integrase [Alphaproteobacteria bacterium]|nr:site-specific integrase [Alphaproteobacteria bacterium]
MENKNGKLFLSEDDVENIVALRVKEIQKNIDKKYFAIKDNKLTMDDLSATLLQKSDFLKSGYSGDYEEFKNNVVIGYIKKYFSTLKNSKNIPDKILDFLNSGIQEKNILSAQKQRPEWFSDLLNYFLMADDYVINRVKAIQNNSRDFYVAAIIERCLRYIDEEYLYNNVRMPNVKTLWTVAYQKFEEYKKTVKGTGENRLYQCRSCLEVIFALINKKYVESLNVHDCEFISSKIYFLPKNYLKQKLPKDKKLRDYLLPYASEKTIATSTAKKYLNVFKEFLAFCQRKGYVNQVLNVQIEVPSRNNGASYDRFSKKELIKIFDADNYFLYSNKKFLFRFYVMLLGLYSGARLNELCQIYCDDVKKQGNIYYIDINDSRSDQHLKNKSSNRLIPVHPKLVEMGFIDYIKKVREQNNERVFYQFTYSGRNHYTDKMSKWFGRYLDYLGIESRKKVFHSFRHTVKPELRDAGVKQEYQNMICGWEGRDTGERFYGRSVNLKILYREICKLQYPYLEESFQKIKEKYFINNVL